MTYLVATPARPAWTCNVCSSISPNGIYPQQNAALAVIDKSWRVLEDFPFTCRKAATDTPLLRELHIPFGNSGYVALFEIEDADTVTVLAVRHQREDDYH